MRVIAYFPEDIRRGGRITVEMTVVDDFETNSGKEGP
jgi:hypothetical protein